MGERERRGLGLSGGSRPNATTAEGEQLRSDNQTGLVMRCAIWEWEARETHASGGGGGTAVS